MQVKLVFNQPERYNSAQWTPQWINRVQNSSSKVIEAVVTHKSSKWRTKSIRKVRNIQFANMPNNKVAKYTKRNNKNNI